jgi:hypothetical protein
VDELSCDKCKPGYFNFSKNNPEGCSKCVCNPDATINLANNLTLCDDKTGQCKCKSIYVQGTKCDTCMESMFNLETGCTDQCNCDPFGSLNPICDQKTGRCNCKPNIGGTKCNICQAGFFNLTAIGCISNCDCDSLGSFNQSFCDTITGQCLCKPGYAGRNCKDCQNGYWRPNLNSACVKCTCNIFGILNQNNICDKVNFLFF